jgi:hypothetical protein
VYGFVTQLADQWSGTVNVQDYVGLIGTVYGEVIEMRKVDYWITGDDEPVPQPKAEMPIKRDAPLDDGE